MKALLTNTRIAAIGLMTVFTFAFTAPSLANTNKEEPKEKNAIPIELKYRGTIDELLMFDLVFNNTEESVYRMTIRDMNGTVWFKTKLRGDTFSKRFSLYFEEPNAGPLQLEVTDTKTDQTVVYGIERSSKTIESVAINKVK